MVKKSETFLFWRAVQTFTMHFAFPLEKFLRYVIFMIGEHCWLSFYYTSDWYNEIKIILFPCSFIPQSWEKDFNSHENHIVKILFFTWEQIDFTFESLGFAQKAKACIERTNRSFWGCSLRNAESRKPPGSPEHLSLARHPGKRPAWTGQSVHREARFPTDTSDCSLIADADARGIDTAFCLQSKAACELLDVPSSDSVFNLLHMITEQQWQQ